MARDIGSTPFPSSGPSPHLVTLLGISCLSKGKTTEWGTDCMTWAKAICSSGLGVPVSKMCVLFESDHQGGDGNSTSLEVR